ncbi:segregation and condensation protein B [Thalassotalea loyana]|uniref:Segregation and condensation protein B n=1 Tax=Thalassotalea loyana TaxID=280483 RepID=A0ABQ6HFQ6_9GAMM|nr:SMC-Scp complex subunit ScpB [Thalassotalea loyana]GLX86925.1 segregation and condensation protein B [Thalassotalea loyana]
MKKIDDKQVVKLIEAAVFVADKPLSKNQIKSTVLSPYQVSAQQFNRAIKQLIADYQDRGIVFLEVASGYRFQAIDEVAEELSLLFQEKAPKYSRALLETLALIAYKQPITRGEIEEVRGVAVSSHIMKTLQDREWIKVVGNKEVPGRPALYATTKAFLDYFSLTSLAQLPELMPVPTMNLADDLTPIKESADSA